MAWIYLAAASLGEVFGVLAINLYIQSKSIGRLFMVVISFLAGFFFLSLAVRDLPLGTAYAVWTGLGTIGAVLLGIIFFNENADWKRILFLACIVTGAVGLRMLE